MKVLALDLSLHVGFAVGLDREKPVHGVWELGRTSALGRCFSCLAQEIEAAIVAHCIDAIIIEAPLPQQRRDTQQTARLLIGLAAVAEMIAYEREVPITEAFPNEARQMVLGTARVTKDGIISWCRSQGWAPISDDDADALLLLRYRHLLGRMRVMAGAGSATGVLL